MLKPNSIEFYRKKKKLSQGALGKLVGANFRTISGYEKGANVSDDVWKRLEKALGEPVEKLKASAPVSYRISSEIPDRLMEPKAPEWLEFVEWLTAEIPMETFEAKASQAFRAKWDRFEDWLRILMRRRRDAEAEAASSVQDVADAEASVAHAQEADQQRPGLPPKPEAVAPSGRRSSPSGGASKETTVRPGTPEKVQE